MAPNWAAGIHSVIFAIVLTGPVFVVIVIGFYLYETLKAKLKLHRNLALHKKLKKRNHDP